ncbi:MAG: hypothetical protein HeimC3_42700 [Candidatus Heimdallarchaeota archaeon LC_3]|nr:MAG: hypothetical protein HeimC3_42700 [Candidatus Heimdallarchaeota archaeon LC_3]
MICSSCYQYVSEKTCPNCGALGSNLTNTLTPKRIDLKSLSINLTDLEIEENSPFSVKRNVSVIALNRNKKITFLNLPWIHSNGSNTHQWLEFTRTNTENDTQLKFRLNISFFSPSQGSDQVIFTRPVQEIKFQLSDAFILLYPDPATAIHIFEQLSEMNLVNRPIYLFGDYNIPADESVPYNMFLWRSSEIALNSLAKAIVYYERNIDINFIINTSPRRGHIVISDVIEGWDGTPTIKLLDINSEIYKENNKILDKIKSETKILYQNEKFGTKCLGHGQKLPEGERFAFCEECKGPICKNCYLSFETICPGSLFTNNHYLPPLKE